MRRKMDKVLTFIISLLMILTLTPLKVEADTGAIAIDSANAAATLTLYKDANHTNAINDDATIKRTDSVYGALAIVFNTNSQPDASKLSYTYAFPENITVTDKSSTPLMNGSETAGTWNISNNVLTFTYDAKWIAAGHTSNIQANFNFDFKVINNTDSSTDSSSLIFPAVANPVTIKYDKGNVTGSKTAKVNSDNTITFTINLNADKDCDLNLTDTMGSNLSFVDGSFKLDDNTALTPSINGQTMTLSKYAIKKGSHTITYNATVIDPSLDTNGDGNIDNVGNDAKWTWDEETTPQDAPVTPNITYNKVSKTGVLNSDNTITWTVTLNNGDIKADMNGYVYTDKLETSDDQKYTGTYTIVDSDKKVLVSDGTLDPNKSSFTYTFPADAGKKTYIVTYKTSVTSKDSLVIEKNLAEGTPSDGKGGHSAEGVIGNYITKEITDKSQVNTTGVVSWKSTAKLESAGDTFSDTYDWNSNIWFTDGESPVLKYTDSTGASVTMVEGNDYSIKWNSQSGEGADKTHRLTFDITFNDTVNVRNAIANNHGEYTVEYTSTCNKSIGTYKNTSTINHNGTHHQASASYTIEDTTNIYKSGSVRWDSTAAAWVADWKVALNGEGYTNYGKVDLEGKDVTIVDTLPKGMTYSAGSAKYSLSTDFDPKYIVTGSVTPEITTDANGNTVLTFTVPTKNTIACGQHTYPKIVLDYSTVADKLAIGEKKSYTNKASASTDSVNFGSYSATVDVYNKVLDKSGILNSNTALVDYTIDINKPTQDLVKNKNIVTLVDTLDYRTYLVNDSVKITDATDSKDITSSCSVKTATVNDASGHKTTQISIDVPDNKHVTVTYSTGLSGKVGAELNDVTNTAELSDISKTETNSKNSFTVANAAGSTNGTAGSITIQKADSDNISKSLSGAEFTLYKVNNLGDLSADSKEEDIKASIVDTETTADDGTVKFHDSALAKDAETALQLDTLYYFVETKAPAGYTISNTGRTYFMLAGTVPATSQAQLSKANAILGKSGVSVNTAFKYNVYDSKSDKGSLQIKKDFTVNGTELTDEEKNVISFTITGPNSYSKTVKYSDFTNGIYTLSDLKSGSYKVTESGADINGYTRATIYSVDGGKTSTTSPSESTVTAGNTATVEISNVYTEVGNLKITKSFTGVESSKLTEAQKEAIVFTVTGPADFNQTYKYSDFTDGNMTISNLPAGDYTVTETGKASVNGMIASATYKVGTSEASATAPTVTVSKSGIAEVDVTNTYSSATGSLNVKKTFAGAELTDEQKKAVKFTVTGPDNYSKEFTYGDFTSGVYSLTGLQTGDYTVTESNSSVDGYTVETAYSVADGKTTVTAGNTAEVDVTNTYTKLIDVSVKKIWSDNGNQDGIRSSKITVQLYANGNPYLNAVTLDKSDSWSYTFKDLPTVQNGNAVAYTINETDVPTGYTPVISGTAEDGFAITNTHTPETTSVSGTKTWSDNDNQDGERPDSVTVRLLADGIEKSSAKVSAETDWKYSFENLPKYSNGTAITYTVTEDAVKDYSSKIVGYDITNTHTPGKTSLSVTKAWKDSNNADKLRPSSVKVQLYADGEAYGNPIMLNESENWTYTWTDLDINKSGKKIKYTVGEVNVPNGYTVTVSGDSDKGYTLTNTHTYTPKTPDTSDHSSLFIDCFAMMASLISAGYCFVFRKKHAE